MLKDTHLKASVVSAKTVSYYSIAVLEYLKEHTLTNFRQLIDIVVYDIPGKVMRFSCVYLLLNLLQNTRFSLSIKTDEVSAIDTLTVLYESAN